MSKPNQTPTTKSSPSVRMTGGGKNLTSNAGLIPVIKFLEKMRFHNLFQSTVAHQRKGMNARWKLEDGVAMSLLSIVAGARSMDGIVRLWHSDRVLSRLANRTTVMAATTLSRLFKTVGDEQVIQLELLNHRLRKRAWQQAGRFIPVRGEGQSIWIDVDSTVKTVYGNQEGAARGYNPHRRGAKSYHPLLAFCAETKELLQGWLRTGSAHTASGVVEFMKRLAAQLPDDLRIVFRGDSGYFCNELLDWLEQRGAGYLIKARIKGLAAILWQQEWQPVPGHPGWEQVRFSHKCGTWKKSRRFVALRKRKEECSTQETLFDSGCYDWFCYVTTEELTPWETHKRYGERATCECWIDEAKNQMGLAHIKTSNFLANSVLFHCSVLAYNTLRWMALISGNAQLFRWEMMSLRAYMIRVAGKLVSGGRRLVLKTPDEMLYPKVWQSWLQFSVT